LLKLYISSSAGTGQQACYDEEGNLKSFIEGGGTVQRSHYRGHQASGTEFFFSHWTDDVMPYVYCCKWSFNQCFRYADVRPTAGCENFAPPAFGK